jgi:hypothetical protein
MSNFGDSLLNWAIGAPTKVSVGELSKLSPKL